MLRFFKGILGAIFSHPHIITAGAALFLIILVLGSSSSSLAPEWKLIAILTIVFVWTVTYLISRNRALQGGRLIEESMKADAAQQILHTAPQGRADVEALTEEFEKSIKALKQSKLGKGYGGDAALYELPWFMIIGPSGGGKTTALKYSGLQFPYGEEKDIATKGVGGTRNCDWFFSSNSILLDTAGRYVGEETDREEWLEFLELLKKYRKQKPINGVVLAIPWDQLMKMDEDGVEAFAKELRPRIDELISRLGIIFPIYLIVTKCDLLDGFVPFFRELSKNERKQILGITFPKKRATTELAHQLFDSEMRNLISSIHRRGLVRLLKIKGTDKKKVFGFPLQVEACQNVLSKFIEVLFSANPFEESPLFRGVYLTSATQEGTPFDRVFGPIGGGTEHQAVPSIGDPEDSKSYFLENVFKDVLVPDQFLVEPSQSAMRRRRSLKMGATLAACIGSVLGIALLLVSYWANIEFLQEVEAFVQAPSFKEHTGKGNLFIANVEHLEQIRVPLAQIQEYEEGLLPLRLWGFYQGSELYPNLLTRYRERIKTLLVIPTQDALERKLSAFVTTHESEEIATTYGEHYDWLKTYLMMAEPRHLDASFLTSQLTQLWTDHLAGQYGGPEKIPATLLKNLLHQIGFYAKILSESSSERLSSKDWLVTNVRKKLREVSGSRRVYEKIVKEAKEKGDTYSLNVGLDGLDQGILVSEGRYTFPTLFTKKGWETTFLEEFHRLAKGTKGEDWVMGKEEQTSPETLLKEVTAQYFNDYKNHWVMFLKSLRIRPVTTMAGIDDALGILGGDMSPLHRTMRKVVMNTGLDSADSLAQNMLAQLATEVRELIPNIFGTDEQIEAGDEKPKFTDPVFQHFKSLHRFVGDLSDKEKKAPIHQYLTELGKVNKEVTKARHAEGLQKELLKIAQEIALGQENTLTQAYTGTKEVLSGLDFPIQEALAPLFLEPVRLGMQAIMDQTLIGISESWEKEVFPECDRLVARWYPFLPTGEPAPIQDVENFFHPQDGLLWDFYKKNLKPFIDENRDSWGVRTNYEVTTKLSPEVAEGFQYGNYLTKSLYQGNDGGLSVSFVLSAEQVGGKAGSKVSETKFVLGKQELIYNLGPPVSQTFKWPASPDSNSVKVQVKAREDSITTGSEDGPKFQVFKTDPHKGDWSLFRLLDQREELNIISPTKFTVSWKVNSPYEIRVPYEITTKSEFNPFQPDFFTKFRCMRTIL